MTITKVINELNEKKCVGGAIIKHEQLTGLEIDDLVFLVDMFNGHIMQQCVFSIYREKRSIRVSLQNEIALVSGLGGWVATVQNNDIVCTDKYRPLKRSVMPFDNYTDAKKYGDIVKVEFVKSETERMLEEIKNLPLC